MTIQLYHHSYSRAAGVVWMLEECGVPYELIPVDLMKGAHMAPEFRALNPMGKVPVLVDGGEPFSEAAAIGVYLADRYASGRLAPALDDPKRGTYLKWCFYSPSVVEPGCMAHMSKWEYKPSAAGFGKYEDILTTLEAGLSEGPWLLGEQCSMADIILGNTLMWMMQFNMIDKRPSFVEWTDRLAQRPAKIAANERNAQAAPKG